MKPLFISVVIPIACMVSVAVETSAFFTFFDRMKSTFYDYDSSEYECCETKWASPNITHLATSLDTKLHGQHLVQDLIVKSIQAHTRPNRKPSKALVLSFHGVAGGGGGCKNFVSQIIADSLYREGMHSKFVHLFIATVHFPHQQRVETYKDQVREWVKGNVSLCERSLFIFDEMDKMPHGLIDTIKPYTDFYQEINGVDYRRSIFIFLSNTGASQITKTIMSLWDTGINRDAIQLKDMEDSIMHCAFNEDGGLWHSYLLEETLVDAFVPFLPLERRHVKMCIKDNLEAKGYPVTEEILNRVADELRYFPSDRKLFSKSGCKRVSQKVDLVMEDINF